MSKIWQPQSIDIYKAWIDTIFDESSDSLTDWETNFVESINNQLDNNKQLTERQAEILERIYTEKTK